VIEEEEEDDDDDDDECWLAELGEPEEAHFAKPMSAGVEERREKERGWSFGVQDLPSSPRPAEGAHLKRLSLAYGASELSKALQALMHLQQLESDHDSSEGEDSVGSANKGEKKKKLQDRPQNRRSLLSLLRDKGTR
jgi:hypothetical protein